MTDAFVGTRVRLEYFDHNESFAPLLPVEGTVTRRCRSTAGMDDWYLVELAHPIDYQHRIGPHFQFERVVASRVLVRSRWADEPLGPDSEPSVFLLLVREAQAIGDDPLVVDDFIHACWARCRPLSEG